MNLVLTYIGGLACPFTKIINSYKFISKEEEQCHSIINQQ
nr:MAG TPA: hypothetical protein [Caudoviricetes sp.]